MGSKIKGNTGSTKTCRSNAFQPYSRVASRSTRPLNSTFYKHLPCFNFVQVTQQHNAHLFSIMNYESAAAFLEQLNPIPTLKTTCGKRVECKNAAR
ncbi:hypothetical protein TNCV_2539971 [Trichonephila clavipes]|nr:hypothetical protein TNCV_2539971 [Trichonephila clavipes]